MGLYSAIQGLDKVIAISRITSHVAFAVLSSKMVFSDRLAVFAFADSWRFSVLQSTLHYVWAWEYSITNLAMLSYSPSACFDSFPFPQSSAVLQVIGDAYLSVRHNLMIARQDGLTKTYNRFHSRRESSGDIVRLRELQVEMDQAVATAYGWNDLDLGHGFRETKQGERFTISEAGRRTVLDRLLALNQQRHIEEEAAKAQLAISAPVKRLRKKRGDVDKSTLDLL
jgi:hypothetical protein